MDTTGALKVLLARTTSLTASASDRAFANTSAEYSPRECPLAHTSRLSLLLTPHSVCEITKTPAATASPVCGHSGQDMQAVFT